VVTVGVFDGVHLGHQAIMRIIETGAEGYSARSVVITFDRNPVELAADSVPPYITTLRQKLGLIAQQGINLAVVLPLERRIIDMPAEEFVSSVLCEKLAALQVVVGTNFRFGRERSGDVRLLREMGTRLGFEVVAVSPIRVDGVTISSTVIRRLLVNGKVEMAGELLGHPFALEGRVVPGRGIGRDLGYPTANIQPAEKQVVPGSGVYAVSVQVYGKRWTGAANIGVGPTVGGREATVEVHILGFSGNILGEELQMFFHHRLRDEILFADAEALKAQIRSDIEQAAVIIGKKLAAGIDSELSLW